MNYSKVVVVPKKGSRKGVQKKDGVIVNYHGPYVDSSGEKFYLPRKWTLCPTTSDDGKMQRRYKECGINYSFKPDEMKGGDLMKNVQWLGQFGCLRTLLDRGLLMKLMTSVVTMTTMMKMQKRFNKGVVI